MKRLMQLLATALVGFNSTGCEGAVAESPPVLPILLKRSGAEALRSGVTMIAGSCVAIDAGDGGPPILILWPPGYSGGQDDTTNEWVVLDQAGAIVARPGSRLRLGGGEIDPSRVSTVSTPIPADCLTGRYWATSEVAES